MYTTKTDGKALPLSQRAVVEILLKHGGAANHMTLVVEYWERHISKAGDVRRPLAILCDAGLVKKTSLFLSDSSLTDAEYEALQDWSTDGSESQVLYVLAEDV